VAVRRGHLQYYTFVLIHSSLMLIKNMFSNFSDILCIVYIYATYLLVLASLDSEMSTCIFIEN